ncbi:MAG: Flp1 family type IVb pilin [Lachnospira sp.]
MKRGFKTFLKEEDGMGVVEIILIIVVLVSLVAIFKKEITSVVNTILKKDIIAGKGNLNRSADRMNKKVKAQITVYAALSVFSCHNTYLHLYPVGGSVCRPGKSGNGISAFHGSCICRVFQ